MKHTVYIFTIVKFKVPDVEAESQEAAIRKAEGSLSFHDVNGSCSGVDLEWAEEHSHFLVDEAGDEEHQNSRWYVPNGDEYLPTNWDTSKQIEVIKAALAAAENMLLHHGHLMSQMDRLGRKDLIDEAKGYADEIGENTVVVIHHEKKTKQTLRDAAELIECNCGDVCLGTCTHAELLKLIEEGGDKHADEDTDPARS